MRSSYGWKPLGLALSLSLPTAGAWAQEDFSDDFNNPTVFTLTAGTSTFRNTVVNSGSDLENADTDFFTLIVPTGLQIDGINLTLYAQRRAGTTLDEEVGIEFEDFEFNTDAFSFVGFEAASQLTHNSAGDGSEQALFAQTATGFALVGQNDVGAGAASDLRSILAAGDVVDDQRRPNPEDQFFNPADPLSSGSYAFVFQDTGTSEILYELTFQTSAIPEPNTLVLLGLAASMSVFRPRRRSLEN